MEFNVIFNILLVVLNCAYLISTLTKFKGNIMNTKLHDKCFYSCHIKEYNNQDFSI